MAIFSQSSSLFTGVSAAQNQTSQPVVVNLMNQVIVDWDFSGSFNGTLYIESATSGDSRPIDLLAKQNEIRWKVLQSLNIQNGLTPSPDSNAFWWAEILTAASLLRVRYVFSAGTGLINCNIMGKSYG